MIPQSESFNHDVASLEQLLGNPIPSDLRNLFRQANFENGPKGLMKPGQAAIDHEAIRSDGMNWRTCCPFWSDYNSNFAAMYLAGPLSGKVCFFEHGAPDLSPVYRTLSSFLEALTVAKREGNDWYQWQLLPTDYPTRTEYYLHRKGQPTPATNSEKTRDLEIAAVLRSQLARLPASAEDDRRYLSYCIIGLTPAENQNAVLEFLNDADPWIQARAATVVGLLRYLPAVPKLADIAFHGPGNAVIASINALGRIGTPECREVLMRCVAAISTGYAYYLGGALKACGCEATHDSGKWRYRLPGDKSWRAIN
jgi:hypothetical protein